MRRFALAVFASACFALPAGGAAAKTVVNAKTKYYKVSGTSGIALIKGMDRKGPRHGFMTRAIAQTSYTIGWEFTWEKKGKYCRLTRADGLLDVTYTYPTVASSVSPDLKRRWNAFIEGVREHEETHGKLAKDMVRAAERSVKGVKFTSDPNCKRAQTEVKRRIGAVYAKYEARQIAFDKREHKDGGNVERLLLALAGKD